MRYMIEVVQAGSFNKAAKHLYISQSTLSTTIKELENEIGIDLFIRTNTGISLTVDGIEFLGYARQIVEQTQLLEQRYLNKKPAKSLFSVSTQHYAFAVNAFVEVIQTAGGDEYEFTLRETKTHEIIDDVKNQRSEIGILYKNDFNRKVIEKLLKEHHLVFHSLFEARPHVFISSVNPLAEQEFVTLADLEAYPYLSFDQGVYNSFYYSEEILSTIAHPKAIRVSDRATLFNLLIGLNGYTISTGILSTALNGTNIVAIPLKVDEVIQVGWIANAKTQLSRLGELYIHKLTSVLEDTQLTL
nr:LysR family transcriptional regulator [Vagococcus allomyrinae]